MPVLRRLDRPSVGRTQVVRSQGREISQRLAVVHLPADPFGRGQPRDQHAGPRVVRGYSIDGPVAFVPARIALLLERTFGLDSWRINVRGRDPELDAVLASFHAVAMQYDPAKTTTSDCGSSSDTGAEVVRSSPELTTTAVADLFDITPRAVRLAASNGQLKGRHVGGQWRFNHHDVNAWAAARRST